MSKDAAAEDGPGGNFDGVPDGDFGGGPGGGLDGGPGGDFDGRSDEGLDGRPDEGPGKGVDEAFADAYRTHYWAVSRFVARRLDSGQTDDVEEVVAEVFSIAWRRRAELPPSPLPWLYGVARNCLSNTVRGFGRYRRLLHRLGNHEAAHRRQTVDSPDTDRPGSWVHEALERLSPADQEVLRLTAWEELTLQELAVTLDCSQSAAAMRLHRARNRLRMQIDRLRPKGTPEPGPDPDSRTPRPFPPPPTRPRAHRTTACSPLPAPAVPTRAGGRSLD
ncbi:RNA polymerase sigma factor [Streptomyces sp. CB02923]|uniref:RNA polymerase sigma factor n=1 Tax=Streptomyces sp. CB02923 TaxID=1718985 RepID=UPI0009A0A917|nr:sigma-70 family RNA polymerase sigma factor [Streptomyces sp. CB02923]